MKAELKQDGTLVVSAETGTEAFALAAWQARYQRGTKEFRTTLETHASVPVVQTLSWENPSPYVFIPTTTDSGLCP
jgi:hypothetical protein